MTLLPPEEGEAAVDMPVTRRGRDSPRAPTTVAVGQRHFMEAVPLGSAGSGGPRMEFGN